MLPSLVIGLALTVDLLGPPLKLDGYQLRPPQGFRMTRMDLFHGTHAAAVSVAPHASRFVSAALLDGEGEDAASLVISLVEAPFALGPSARDELSNAVLRHFRDELGLPFVLERAEVVGHAAVRVQVVGSVRQGSQLRRIVVGAYPGAARHVVALVSAPAGRWEELRPAFEVSLDSLRLDAVSAGLPRPWGWALLALIASLLAVSVGVWRRRQAARDG